MFIDGQHDTNFIINENDEISQEDGIWRDVSYHGSSCYMFHIKNGKRYSRYETFKDYVVCLEELKKKLLQKIDKNSKDIEKLNKENLKYWEKLWKLV